MATHKVVQLASMGVGRLVILMVCCHNTELPHYTPVYDSSPCL